ncbi:dTDP-4-dehydrorhamnose reductase [Stutzerimonas stutzeri]
MLQDSISNQFVTTFLVCGGSGQIGQSIVQQALGRGINAVAPSSQTLDITNAASIDAALRRYRPALIINSAAYTDVDGAEHDAARAYAINRDGVQRLAEAADRAGIPIFHISTDYVFSGNGNRAYAETEPTQPCSVYGASKLAGEHILTELTARHLVIRTSWVYSTHGKNFVKTMLRLGRERSELSIVDDQIGCPTYAVSIARTLLELGSRYVQEGELPWGLYHYSGGPACSWYEFASQIFKQAVAFGLLESVPKLNPVPTINYPTPASRPAWSVLDCQKFESTFAIPTHDWRSELHEFFVALADCTNVSHLPAGMS